MARGVRFGRKPKLTQSQVAEAIRRRDAGEAMTDIGRSYGVSHSTISRLRFVPFPHSACGSRIAMTPSGSLSPDTFRARRMLATEGVGPKGDVVAGRRQGGVVSSPCIVSLCRPQGNG